MGGSNGELIHVPNGGGQGLRHQAQGGLVGWSVGWLVCWLVGLLVGWFVGCRVKLQGHVRNGGSQCLRHHVALARVKTSETVKCEV
jgi:hypothetical protein